MQIELSVFYARLGAIALILILGFILGKLKLISEKSNRELTNLLLTVFSEVHSVTLGRILREAAEVAG